MLFFIGERIKACSFMIISIVFLRQFIVVKNIYFFRKNQYKIDLIISYCFLLIASFMISKFDGVFAVMLFLICTTYMAIYFS